MEKLSYHIELTKKDISKGIVLPKILTNELAYICGILVGDGSISKRIEKNEYSIKCVGNPKDEKDLYHKIIGPRFNDIFGFTPEIRLMDSNTTYGLRIHSKTLFRFFTEVIGLHYGRKDQKLNIPRIIKENPELTTYFIRGLFDTDGCISFKKKYTDKPYYPVITLNSQSKILVQEISQALKKKGFKVVEMYDYKVKDHRNREGFTIINRVELNGKDNLRLWLKKIKFDSPKHLNKIEEYWEEK